MCKFHKFTTLASVLSVLILLVTAAGCSSPTSATSTKYDLIVEDAEWKAIQSNMEQEVKGGRLLKSYLHLLVSEEDLDQLSRSGEMDREKSLFVSQHKREVKNYMHYVLCASILPTIKDPTDAQYMYVIGVIRDSHAQVATNGPEYEMEKQYLRSFPLYNIWATWKEERTLPKILDEQLDIVLAHVEGKG
jgi:hypothetical protein